MSVATALVPDPPNAAQAGAAVREQPAVALDLGALKALVGDDPQVIQELLAEFQSGSARLGSELEQACIGKRPRDAVAAAHKLKSSARVVGALQLGEICEGMEAAGLASDLSALEEKLPGFRVELAAVQAALIGHGSAGRPDAQPARPGA
jgi:HPt (histidine-containing phosphotransfer) domain-containing protein